MCPTQETDALLNKLIAWGCDVDSALPRFLDDKDLYCTFVRQVADEESFPLLGEAIKKNDAKTAFEKAHELKGVLANMSLTPLYDLVVEIVEPLRAGKFSGVADNYKKLQEQWTYFRTVILG
jgi:hypothetical protein